MVLVFVQNIIKSLVQSDIPVFDHQAVSQAYEITFRQLVHMRYQRIIHVMADNICLIPVAKLLQNICSNPAMILLRSGNVVHQTGALEQRKIKMTAFLIQGCTDPHSNVRDRPAVRDHMCRRLTLQI